MKLKKYALLLVAAFALLFASLPAFSQDDLRTGLKQVEAAHVAWITKELALTPDQAQRFWPVYYNYQREIRSIQQERRRSRQQGGRDQGELDFDSRVLDLRKRYLAEFRKTLPAESADRLFRADREFNERLLKQLGKRKGIR